MVSDDTRLVWLVIVDQIVAAESQDSLDVVAAVARLDSRPVMKNDDEKLE